MNREGRRRWGLNQRFLIGTQGNPMMERWRLVQTPWFGIYVHFIYREDLDPVPHDHPWRFASVVLRGCYIEEMHDRPGSGETRTVVRRAGRVHWFPLHRAHRIIDVVPGTTTLVLVGPKERSWGFWRGREWVDYRDALGLRPTEGVRS